MRTVLEGLLVVSIEQAVAAPICSQRLVDAGARVIKVERPEGDFARRYDHAVLGESAYFVWANRGKESITLDFKKADDAELLHRIIAKADVFIQNLAPGAAARAGFGSEELRRRHARLITCDISGYGEEGAWRDMKAYDLLLQCESGLASITGGADAPGRVGVSIADIACGVTAHGAIMEALFRRERTGRGASVAVSLFDCLAEWMSVPLLHYDYSGVAPERVGVRHPNIAPYGLYVTGDGESVVFAVQNEREWERFCEHVMHNKGLANEPLFRTAALRSANRGELDARLDLVFRMLTQESLIDRLKRADLAYGSMNTVADLSVHPQLRRIRTRTPAGVASLPAPPVRWADEEAVERAVTALGDCDASLRSEFK